MPRPPCQRRISAPPTVRLFKPAGLPACELVEMTMGEDELEALRLADLEGLYQETAARIMGISRQTFGRLVESARRKAAKALVEGACLRIEGGTVLRGPHMEECMKIAVPEVNGMVDEHFGHCQAFAVYEVDAQRHIVGESTMASTQGCGCKSGLAPRLADAGIKVLISGGMGDGALRILRAHGIEAIRGASGPCRAAAEAYLNGKLGDSGEGCQSHAADHVCTGDH